MSPEIFAKSVGQYEFKGQKNGTANPFCQEIRLRRPLYFNNLTGLLNNSTLDRFFKFTNTYALLRAADGTIS